MLTPTHLKTVGSWYYDHKNEFGLIEASRTTIYDNITAPTDLAASRMTIYVNSITPTDLSQNQTQIQAYLHTIRRVE